MALPFRQIADAAIRQNLEYLERLLGGRRIVAGAVTSVGAVARGDDFTVVRNAVGDYTITFSPVFRTVPFALAMASAAGVAVRQSAVTKSTLRVIAFTTSTGAAVDADFTFQCAG